MSRYWVAIGRPMGSGPWQGTRDVLIDGDTVGWIVPTHGLMGTGDKTMARRNRSAGWVVYAARTLAIGAMGWPKVVGMDPTVSAVRAVVGTGARLVDALDIAWAWDGWLVPMWCELSGMHGYMPDAFSCGVGRAAAVESIVSRFDLGGRRARVVRSQGYVELVARDGAEYASVQRCECEACCSVTIADADTWQCSACDG